MTAVVPLGAHGHAALAPAMEVVAWVESPLQLLSIIEAHAAGIVGLETVIVPRAGAQSLESTVAEVTQMRLPSGVRIASPQLSFPRRVDMCAVGDGFSGVVQWWLVAQRPERVVVVDDGLATIEMMRLLALPWAALTRARAVARSRHRIGRWFLGLLAAHTVRIVARNGGVDVFTAMPIPADLASAVRAQGIRLHIHDFRWLRAQPSPPVPHEPTIVIGSSLVSDGLVRRHAYLDWLVATADEGPVAYFPHRREDLNAMAGITSNPNFRVVSRGVPVELCLRGLGDGHRVVSLPSTAAVSLRLLLAGSGATVDVKPVDEDWWTPLANARLRHYLARSASA
jgi:hypothetical protein